MHPLLIAGLFTTAAGLLLVARGSKKQPDTKPDILQADEKARTPAPVHPEPKAASETDSTDSSGRITDVDPVGDPSTPAPAIEGDTTAATAE